MPVLFAGTAAIGESTFVILLGGDAADDPAASLAFVTAPFAIFDVVTAVALQLRRCRRLRVR